MNLNAYDNVNEKIDKTKTWIDIEKNILYSREIKYRPYYSLMKRYDAKTGVVSFFIAMLDDWQGDKNIYNTRKDDYGRVKISLSPLGGQSSVINYLIHQSISCNIDIEHIEESDDGDVYYLDI